MKLKCVPEDFVVEEVSQREPTRGAFALYELWKRGIGTPEALQIFQRECEIAAQRVSHAGLKDRHAVTIQRITVKDGPPDHFDHDCFRLRYLGTTPKPLSAEDILANRFQITLRSLSEAEARGLQQQVRQIEQHGYLNYFDEQRFGSLGPSGEFIAAHWCRKNYERALWLALAEHNSHDRPQERQQKAILRDGWGQWQHCKDQLDRSHRRSIVTYLVDHPEGFRKAFALLKPTLRGLYLSAFQSAVWNRMLGFVVAEAPVIGHRPALVIAGETLPAAVPSEILPEIPLPSARLKKPGPPLSGWMVRALEPFGMQPAEMKVSFPRDRWFSRARRATIVRPNQLCAAADADELNAGRQKLTLSFELPRGCYATMLIRSLTAVDAVHSAD